MNKIEYSKDFHCLFVHNLLQGFCFAVPSKSQIILISYGRIKKGYSFVLGGNENKLISFWDFLTFTNKNWFGCLLIKNLGVDSSVLCKMTHFTIPRIHSLTERFNPLITFLAFITQQPCQINKLQNSAAYFFS